jgi:hypothetical protein
LEKFSYFVESAYFSQFGDNFDFFSSHAEKVFDILSIFFFQLTVFRLIQPKVMLRNIEHAAA